MALVNAADLVKRVRNEAGLTQRELAQRAGMSQPALAKIERGVTLPRFDTLERLVDACGYSFSLESPTSDVDPQDWAQSNAILALSPADRIKHIESGARTFRRLREAGKKARGARKR